MEPTRVRTCEVCGVPLYSGTDTRCKRCMASEAAAAVQNDPRIPDRGPILAKPDERNAIRNVRQEYDGIPDPELPSYVPDPDHRGFTAVGPNGQNNPSNAAYKTWAKVVGVWAAVTLILTTVLIWKHHFIAAVVWAAAGAVILGFCTPNRYMQEEFDAEEWFTHRASRVIILGMFVGLPVFAAGQLLGWILGKIF